MPRIKETPISRSGSNKPFRAAARRLRMSPILTSLDDKIVALLNKAANKAMSLQDIEEALAKEAGHRFDTFEVRDAVWRLIDKKKADFTPFRDLKAVGA